MAALVHHGDVLRHVQLSRFRFGCRENGARTFQRETNVVAR
jgi:hypothetical protein